MWTKRGMGWVIMAVLAAGCAAAQPEPAVTLRLVDRAGLAAEIAACRGRVTVLDCWSTSCPPCVRDFPRLVALSERHRDTVACLSLSFDYEGIGTPADVVPKVRAFLEASGARRVTNLLGTEESDALAAQLELVGVPAVFVYDRDGNLLERFDEESARKRLGRPFTYDDVEATVREALGAAATRE